MPILKLDNSKEPQLVVSVTNSLNYRKSDGEVGERKPHTAAIDVIRDAASTASMQVGAVIASFKQGGDWKNYFVNYTESGITMKPVNSIAKSDTIYLNKYLKDERADENGVIYKPVAYMFSKNNLATQNFVESLSIKRAEESNYGYLECRVVLKNDEIKQSLLKAGKDHIAILSKDGVRIEPDPLVQFRKEQALAKEGKENVQENTQLDEEKDIQKNTIKNYKRQ